MARNLYRIYLYAVCIILLEIATAVTGVSLGMLLSSTPLRAIYGTPPDRAQLVQAIVALFVVWLVTLLLGGLHYWLIRRDMATDPEASGGAVRSFFLNVTQLLAALIAIGTATVGIAVLGDRYNSPIGYFSTALASGGLFALLQVERQRTPVTTRGALALQRLHLYGAQLGIVLIATPFWLQAASTTVLKVAASTGAFDPCGYYYAGSGCSPSTYYPLRQAVAQWIAALFIAGCWAGYTAFSRADRHSRLRQVTHLLAFGYGVVWVLRGVQGIFESLLRSALGSPASSNEFVNGAAQVTGSLVFGIVVVLAYRWLHTREAAALPSGQPAAGLAQWALVGVIFAYPFWVGAAMLLRHFVEHIVPAGAHPGAVDFAQAGAMLLSGIPFVGVTVWLGARTRQTGVTWPHRAFVLVLLAGGAITTAAGLVICLQAVGSTLLGAPPDGWQQTARTGLVTLLIGATMAALFVTLAVRNRYLGGHEPHQEPKPVVAAPAFVSPPDAADTQPVATPGGEAVTPESLEAILDALLAGQVTRDEAAARIRTREVAR